MARQPSLPNDQDPTGVQRRVAGAQNDFERRINTAFNRINAIIKELPYTKVEVNQSFVVTNGLNIRRAWMYSVKDDSFKPDYTKRDLRTNETVYRYGLSAFELNRLNETISQLIERLFLVDDEGNLVRADNGRQLWLMNGYVEPSYMQGTNQAFNELSVQSAIYASSVSDVEQIFFSEPYQRRIGFVAAKEYQVIKGFTDDMVKDTTRILTEAIALGNSPREASREIQSRLNVAKSKANLISRTEIPMALRQAKWQESEQAQVNFGLETRLMHMSAFKATSRKSHMARTGGIYTRKEVKDWYAVNGNAFSCYCSQIVQVVDEEGKPLNDGAQKKLLNMKKKFTGA